VKGEKPSKKKKCDHRRRKIVSGIGRRIGVEEAKCLEKAPDQKHKLAWGLPIPSNKVKKDTLSRG